MEWSRLKFEVSRKLDEDEIKLERMKIPIDFEDLGFRILLLAATSNPQGTREQRLNTLEERAAELLEGRHMLLPHVQKCSERLQALPSPSYDLGGNAWGLHSGATKLGRC